MRRRNWPPAFFANSQFSSAVRALPTCSRPVGDGAKRTLTGIAECIRDGIAPVAAEVAWADLYARRRLAALIFADIEQMFNAPHRCGIEASRHDVLERHL